MQLPSRVSFWAPPVVQMALIFALSSMTGRQVGRLPFAVADWVAHAALFGALAALLLRAFASGAWDAVTGRAAILAAALAALYGATDEYHQRFVPGRSVSGMDLIVDAVGASAASGVCWAWGIMRRFRRRASAR